MTDARATDPRTPAIDPLRDMLARLDRAGIVGALGGSGLLASLGLWDTVRDWDVTTDAAVDDVAAALAGEPHERFGSSGIHADHKLVLRGGEIEIICRFALRSEAGVCRVPTRVISAWRGVSVGSPLAWAVAYALMGRDAKAKLLWGHVGRAGTTRDEREALEAQPLPEAVRRRLEAVPSARG
jgi:hypothetical protein